MSGAWVPGCVEQAPSTLTLMILSCYRSKKNEPLLCYTIKIWVRGFPGSSLLKTWPSGAGVWVQSLIGELRSHTSWGQKKKKKNQEKTEAVL